MRSYTDGGRYYPRSYDFNRPTKPQSSQGDSWSKRSEGYSSSYSSRSYSDGNDSPRSSSSYRDTDRYGNEDTRRERAGEYGAESQRDRPVAYRETKDGMANEDYGAMNGSLYNGKESHPYKTRENKDGIEDLMNILSYKENESSTYSSRKNEQEPMKGRPSHVDNADDVFRQSKQTKPDTVENADKGAILKHMEGFTRFVSVIPEENRYISAVNYLPDRIELRLCGAAPKEKKLKHWGIIPDLYNITLKPKALFEEKIEYQETQMDYAFDRNDNVLHCKLPKHHFLKEMYVSQYTHHFDSDEPRSHIAGWKVDVEPKDIPHARSRMCVMRSPVVSGSRERAGSRPKSAPPQLFRFDSLDDVMQPYEVAISERGYATLPRANDPSSRFRNIMMDDDQTDENSSIGYAPSDDTSDSSAFYNGSPRRRREQRFSYSKPKLIQLSAEFPGVRNLEKIRRKRQSMGSVSSTGSLSSLKSPTNGDYGFFFAVTSGEAPKRRSKGRAYSQS